MTADHTPDRYCQLVGLFSRDSSGGLCFHPGESQDPQRLVETLNESVTGGPYTAFYAYAFPIPDKEPHEST